MQQHLVLRETIIRNSCCVSVAQQCFNDKNKFVGYFQVPTTSRYISHFSLTVKKILVITIHRVILVKVLIGALHDKITHMPKIRRKLTENFRQRVVVTRGSIIKSNCMVMQRLARSVHGWGSGGLEVYPL